LVDRFQLMTLTSLSCAPATPMTLLRSLTRTSHTRIERSDEHDAKTVASLGDHWMSSIESVCEAKGFGEGVAEVGVRVVR